MGAIHIQLLTAGVMQIIGDFKSKASGQPSAQALAPYDEVSNVQDRDKIVTE